MAKSKKQSFRDWYEESDDTYDYEERKHRKLPSKKLSKQEKLKLERRNRSRDKRNFPL